MNNYCSRESFQTRGVLTRKKLRGVSRRDFVKYSAAFGVGAITSTGLAGLLPVLEAGVGKPRSRFVATRPLRVVCVGAHPDDPEEGCGGTLSLYAEQGHSVSIIYLTRGELGISGKSMDEAAAIRTKEAEAACKIIGAKPVFAGQIDGATELTNTSVAQLRGFLSIEDPDLVFMHWPIDTHPDHRVASMCTFGACMGLKHSPYCCFFEVATGAQTLGFAPNVYVSISSVEEKKSDALLAHASQNGESIWKTHEEVIDSFRGREARVAMAEAFFQVAPQPGFRELAGL
jgi:LmbE family N-acetylglucosaminyl deacetylase